MYKKVMTLAGLVAVLAVFSMINFDQGNSGQQLATAQRAYQSAQLTRSAVMKETEVKPVITQQSITASEEKSAAVKEMIEEQPPQSRGSFFQRFFRRNVVMQPRTLPMYKITNTGALFDDRTIVVDEDDPTEGELIYVFTFDATEMSDGVELDEIEVELDVDDVAANMVFDDLSLVYNGVVLGTGNVYNESVLIPNLAHAIPAGAAHSFEIRADLEEADNYPDPTEFTVDLNVSDFEMDVLSTGDPVSLRRVTQSINNFDHMLTVASMIIDFERSDAFVSQTGTAGVPDDIGEFEIEFEIFADGADLYIPKYADVFWSPDIHHLSLSRDGSVLMQQVPTIITATSSAVGYNPSTANYEIEQGDSAEFILNVVIDNGLPAFQQAGQYKVFLSDIKWSLQDSVYNYYSQPLDPNIFSTSTLYLD